jgi:O-antigen/teichoic acid export membrane protein
MNIRKALRNLFSLSFMRLFSALASFVLFNILARYWGSELLGEFSTITTYFMLLMQIPLLGLHLLIIRDVAANPGKTGAVVSSAMAISLSVSILLVVIVSCIGRFLYPESLHAAFYVLSLSCIPTAFIVVIESLLIGQEKVHTMALVNIVESVLRSLVCILLFWAGFGLVALISVYLICRFAAMFAYLLNSGINTYLKSGIDRRQVALYMVKMPTFLAILIFSASIGRLDFIFLSLVGNMQDVGLYAVPFKLYELGLMIPSMIVMVLFPTFARLFNESRTHFNQAYSLLVRAMVISGLPACITVAYLSSDILHLLFGEEYMQGTHVLQLLSFAVLFMGLDQLLSTIILAGKREDLELKVLAITFIAYLAMLTALVPAYGISGAAWATFLATFIKLIMRYVYAVRNIEMPDLASQILPPVLSGCLMAGALILISHEALALCAAAAVYISALFIFNGISIHEIRTAYRSSMSFLRKQRA